MCLLSLDLSALYEPSSGVLCFYSAAVKSYRPDDSLVSLARLSHVAERESGLLPYTNPCLTPQEFLGALVGSDDVCRRDI